MLNYTMTGTYTLPSLGKVYGNKDVKPDFTLRSMTTAEEMRRLNASERQYKVLADIIDDCMTENIGISAYDLCMADFQYVLHKLRVVTYGKQYKMSTKCPFCGNDNSGEIDLDEMVVKSFDSEFEDLFNIELPVTKMNIRLRMQSPRSIDDAEVRSREMKRRSPNMSGDPAFLTSIQSIIDEIDGKKFNIVEHGEIIKNLPMRDTNYIINCSTKINNSFGLDTSLECKCDRCRLDYTSPFRFTSEFFRPTDNT